jgi:hypothetical protein
MLGLRDEPFGPEWNREKSWNLRRYHTTTALCAVRTVHRHRIVLVANVGNTLGNTFQAGTSVHLRHAN